MKRKKILKALVDLLNRPIVKVIFYLGGMALVLGLSGAFKDNQTFADTFMGILTSQDTLTLFFAGLLSLGVVKLLAWVDGYMEESLKIEDNHHKVISQYSAHDQYSSKKLEAIQKEHGCVDASQAELEELVDARHKDGSYAEKNGEYLMLRHVRDRMDEPVFPGENASRKEMRAYKRQQRKWKKAVRQRVWEKNRRSSGYMEAVRSVERYLRGKLGLCSLNVFVNKSGQTKVRFQDEPKEHQLPSFVITHADELLQAHKSSAKNNSNTIRLNDFEYNEETDEMVLKTGRSTYYHMLITNRCMDYRFTNGISIREVYEYDKEICPLERSKFGNQIGINGLVVTADNYILVEKRDRKKITWKNKFAQSISLAMKVDDMKIHRWDELKNTPEVLQEKVSEIIQKTVQSNFGLLPVDDYEEFEMSHNFLGLARDLLEGGKPNLYFFLRTKHNAAKLLEIMERNVRDKTEISVSKLSSDYYLIPFDQVQVDFGYCMYADRRQIIRVRRKFKSRCNLFAVAWDRTCAVVNRVIRPVMKRECGEALLVTMSYMEMCPRWRYPRNGGKNNAK